MQVDGSQEWQSAFQHRYHKSDVGGNDDDDDDDKASCKAFWVRLMCGSRLMCQTYPQTRRVLCIYIFPE